MLPAKDFGPLTLKAVRQEFVELGWVRVSCNKGLNRIRHIFKYAIGNELIDAGILAGLKCVRPLLEGRTEARNNAPRTAVDDARIDAIKNLAPPLFAI